MIKRLKLRSVSRVKRGLKLAKLQRHCVIQIHVKATFNNTHLTITDLAGNTIIWRSSGSNGFRGKRKKTPYAARSCLGRLLRRIRARGVRRSELIIKGLGKGRRGIGRITRRFGFIFLTIKDKTPMPHNGCRLRKKRRSRTRGRNQKRRKWKRLLKVPFQIKRPDLFKGLKRVSAASARKGHKKRRKPIRIRRVPKTKREKTRRRNRAVNKK